MTKSSLRRDKWLFFNVKGWSPKVKLGVFEEPQNQGLYYHCKILKIIFFLSMSYLRGINVFFFDVRGWSPNVVVVIFQKSKNQRLY